MNEKLTGNQIRHYIEIVLKESYYYAQIKADYGEAPSYNDIIREIRNISDERLVAIFLQN